ncbi:MAG: VWA domain-containing protein [Chloroflexi bacterium UTCFX4]|jgi:Ca-activated chloride channel family protein|nr:MAG: VWA domain-containing protein [Chloroflexi bacterium UTCFX4]
MAGEVSLTCTVHRDNVPVIAQPQIGYILLELMPAPIIANVRMPLNFSFVLDRSGSMGDERKIEQLRDAVKHAIDLLDDDDIVSIVAFEDDAQVLVSSTTARDKNNLKLQVDKLDAGGGTHMEKGMREGLREVRKNLGPGRVNQLVILTDGQTENEDQCRREGDNAGQEGIKIIALGLGNDWNETLLEDVAQRAGGNADLISQPHEIADKFQRVVQAMQGNIVQNALLTLRLAQGVTPRKVWRVAPLISDLGLQPLSDRDVQVPLGELVKDQGQGLMVEVLLPPRAEGRYRIAQADVSYDVPPAQIFGEHARADIVIGYTSIPQLAEQYNPRVMNIAEKVTAFRLQTRALQEAQQGNAAGATQKLRQAATMLLNQGEVDLAKTIQLEADNLENKGAMSDAGKKTIKFQGGKTVKLG